MRKNCEVCKERTYNYHTKHEDVKKRLHFLLYVWPDYWINKSTYVWKYCLKLIYSLQVWIFWRKFGNIFLSAGKWFSEACEKTPVLFSFHWNFVGGGKIYCSHVKIISKTTVNRVLTSRLTLFPGHSSTVLTINTFEKLLLWKYNCYQYLRDSLLVWNLTICFIIEIQYWSNNRTLFWT